jgi:hypothetical protein
MGIYIEKLPDGTPLPNKGKARFLLESKTGVRLWDPSTDKPLPPGLTCVITNGDYDGALVVFTRQEFLRATEAGDERESVWIVVPWAFDMFEHTKEEYEADMSAARNGFDQPEADILQLIDMLKRLGEQKLRVRPDPNTALCDVKLIPPEELEKMSDQSMVTIAQAQCMVNQVAELQRKTDASYLRKMAQEIEHGPLNVPMPISVTIAGVADEMENNSELVKLAIGTVVKE